MSQLRKPDNYDSVPLLYVRSEVLAFRCFCKYCIERQDLVIGPTAYG
jgi:hypothetical protein